MTTRKRNTKLKVVEAVAGDRDLMKALMKEALQEVLEGEMTEFLGAAPGERTEGRNGYRAGYYGRNLVTRIGKLELRVPRDRSGEFSTALFERYARSEKALVAALAEMYVQGVSTRKVKAITEELCGHSFSASAISSINKGLDESLARFAHRQLDEAYAPPTAHSGSTTYLITILHNLTHTTPQRARGIDFCALPYRSRWNE